MLKTHNFSEERENIQRSTIVNTPTAQTALMYNVPARFS